MIPKIIKVGGGDVAEVQIGGTLPLAFLGGPCAIETRAHALEMAERIGE
ncbi:MAG: 3-deoxy-8-phosphooctulonate synthase, partial [Rhodospirillaceae bacterium]|nr:3-deoxy-8-phosphooctulonate synthase [Rhodospirillaceae bacterium]MBT4673781.1 3-deoxy-8-phosphooctulonate synthase [Rhodospirillaceae bacterium]